MIRKFMKRSLHDKVLIFITAMAILAIIFGALGVDGEAHEKCVTALTAGLTWCAVFWYANAERWLR